MVLQPTRSAPAAGQCWAHPCCSGEASNRDAELAAVTLPTAALNHTTAMPTVVLTPGDHEVSVTVDGTPFTNYLWADEGFFLAKPVLNPIFAASGTPVGRLRPLIDG